MMRTGDLALVFLCAALVGAAWWLTWRADEGARVAVLRVPGEPTRQVALDGRRELAVAGSRGESRIAIRPGGARFLESACSGKQCIHAGWLERAGAFAACLPNGVSLTLVGDTDGYDGIGY